MGVSEKMIEHHIRNLYLLVGDDRQEVRRRTCRALACMCQDARVARLGRQQWHDAHFRVTGERGVGFTALMLRSPTFCGWVGPPPRVSQRTVVYFPSRPESPESARSAESLMRCQESRAACLALSQFNPELPLV